MPLEFGRGAFIKIGEEGTYGTIASSMPVDNRIISASFQKTQEKDPDEDIDVWFPVSQLLSPRALASSEKLDFKLINYYDFEVLDSSSVSQSMILLNETKRS